MAGGKSWNEVRGQRALNEARVETYRRLMDAQSQIAELLLARGLVGEEQLDAALTASQAEDSGTAEEEVYLASLTRYVSGLGGHLEVGHLGVTAVFPEVSVELSELPVEDSRNSERGRRAEAE